MNPVGEVIVGLVMLVGLVGVVLPVLPGLLLIAIAAGVWAFEVSTLTGWVVWGAMLAALGLGTALKYRVPQRELVEAKVAPRTWAWGLVCGVVGMLVIPIVGALVGFVVGIYLGERRSTGSSGRARASTKRLLKGIGKGILIEFTAGAVALTIWVAAVLRVV